jgi:ABC-type transport system involved in multi-copper enzyme maturation permease subunit
MLAFIIGKPEIWLTPPWLIAAGVTLAALVMGVAYGTIWAASRRTAAAIADMFREGVLLWLFWIAVGLSVFTVVGLTFAPWREIAHSAVRLPFTGEATIERRIEPGVSEMPIELPFSLDRLASLKLETDEDLSLSIRGETEADRRNFLPLPGGKPVEWTKTSTMPTLFRRGIKDWLVSNTGQRPATLRVTASTGVANPEAATVLVAAIATLAIVLCYALPRWLVPKISAIATTAARETMSQWLFWLVLIGGALALSPLVFPIPSLMYVPYNTFGEDIKMLKETGLTLVLILSLVVALWSAATSIFEEVEGKTALTVLSKPVTRRQFILGKYLGIVWPVAILFIVLGLVFLVTISCKVVYDSRENLAADELTWQLCHWEMVRTVPGLALKFMEVLVLAAISVALSTRLPMLPNLLICVSIYALGHLAPVLVQASADQFPIVSFVSQFLATILPVLDHYHIPGAIVGGNDVPGMYLLWAAAYSAIYAAVALLLALALFEDRDLA